MRVHYLDNGDGARVLTAKCYGRRLVSDGVVSGGSFSVGLEAKPEMPLYIMYVYIIHTIKNELDATYYYI